MLCPNLFPGLRSSRCVVRTSRLSCWTLGVEASAIGGTIQVLEGRLTGPLYKRTRDVRLEPGFSKTPRLPRNSQTFKNPADLLLFLLLSSLLSSFSWFPSLTTWFLTYHPWYITEPLHVTDNLPPTPPPSSTLGYLSICFVHHVQDNI